MKELTLLDRQEAMCAVRIKRTLDGADRDRSLFSVAEQATRQHPWLSFGVAIGAGVLLGSLVGRLPRRTVYRLLRLSSGPWRRIARGVFGQA